MKKLFYMISAVALMASFASCNKIEQGNTSAEAPSIDGTTTITVSATVPQTKTYISGNVVRWSADDVIAILAEKYDPVRSEPIEKSAETHDFTINGWYEGVTPQYAAFTGPYTSDNYYNPYKPVWNADGTILMTVRSGQVIYNQNSFSKIANISLGELVEKDGVFSTEMKNVCGLLKFTLTKPTKSVEFEDMGGGYMCGKVNVKMVGGVPEAAFVDGTGGKITLTSSIKDSEKLLAHDGSYTYYAVVIPGTYTPKVTITSANDESIVLQARTPIKVSRNEYIDLGTLDSFAEEDGDEPGTPDTPSETITITLNIASNPFNEDLPSKNDNQHGPHTYTTKEGYYQFVICNTYDKYAKEGNYLRLTYTSGKIGYIKFPAIPDYKLISVKVTGGNGTSSKKPFHLFAGVPDSEFATAIATTGAISTEDVKTLSIENPIINHSYYLASKTNNAQFPTLVLTYSK